MNEDWGEGRHKTLGSRGDRAGCLLTRSWPAGIKDSEFSFWEGREGKKSWESRSWSLPGDRPKQDLNMWQEAPALRWELRTEWSCSPNTPCSGTCWSQSVSGLFPQAATPTLGQVGDRAPRAQAVPGLVHHPEHKCVPAPSHTQPWSEGPSCLLLFPFSGNQEHPGVYAGL